MFLRCTLLLAACLWVLPASALTGSNWLYSVERPVSAQTDDERRRAAREGLLVVLSRLSGLASVPRTPEVLAALERPDRYYNEFVFRERRDLEAGVQLSVMLTFQRNAVLDLGKRAGLPVWWSKRPQVVAWLVIDGPERALLGSASEHPVVEALTDRALARGVPLTIPLMDLDDNLAVSPADVWGKVGQTLDAASGRYGADLVLTGRLREVPDPNLPGGLAYRGDWEVWVDGAPLVERFTSLDAAAAAARAVDMLADRLAERYAVLPRSVVAQAVSIVGLGDAGAYAAMMRYLATLEFIDAVDVLELDGGNLRLSVASRARREQLLLLLTAEGVLREDSFYRGLDLQLVWQG